MAGLYRGDALSVLPTFVYVVQNEIQNPVQKPTTTSVWKPVEQWLTWAISFVRQQLAARAPLQSNVHYVLVHRSQVGGHPHAREAGH